ncbi:MAG: DUF4383 domain-containing protein [Nodosilinea sp. WJT8-NPBG4]|jgi:hypothetical protein|nr:DUF4383 domain-containing protein [Nodosilinea sp. WJT8-NPBG4]
MMRERNCALVLGILFTALGLAGFIPTLVSLPSSEVAGAAPLPIDLGDTYAQGFGYLFGLFPINLMHNLVHLSVGIFGISASTTVGGARLFNRFFAISYVLIAIMGLVPVAHTTFGLMPIFGNNVWFNAVTALIAGYFGFVAPDKETSISV